MRQVQEEVRKKEACSQEEEHSYLALEPMHCFKRLYIATRFCKMPRMIRGEAGAFYVASLMRGISDGEVSQGGVWGKVNSVRKNLGLSIYITVSPKPTQR